jgi:hypothetical protein
MRGVLESARQAGIAPHGLDRDELLDALRRAQIAYLRVALARAEPVLDPANLDALRRHAMYLDLLADSVGPDQASDARHVVGTIYEWLSRLSPSADETAAYPQLTRGRVGDLVRSSLAYSSGRHEASSAFEAQRALEAFAETPQGDPIAAAAASIVLRLLARRFAELLPAADEYGRAVQVAIAAGPSVDVDWPTAGILGRVAEACACLAAGMVSGTEALLEETGDRLAAIRGLAVASADDVAALLDRLDRVMVEMINRSTFQVLRRAGLSERLARGYAWQRPELWSSQVEAIEAGFLDPDRSFVLSLSTGSGKTFLAQLRILATLERYPESWVAYVAPSRALVREVFTELSRALRPQGVRVQKLVASAEATILADTDEVPVITADRTCAVLTPERLDVYLRSNPDLAARCRLVVVDEAHHISDPDRGARLEALIALLLTKWPESRLVLLSAFMPNSDELQTWLGPNAGVYRSASRPTRQLRGALLRYNEQALPDVWEVGIGRNKRQVGRPEDGWRKWHRRRRTYEIGALLSTDATPPARVPANVGAYALPAIARGTSWTEQSAARAGHPSKVDYGGGTGVADIAVDVGVALAPHPGLVLMFFPGVAWAQSAATRIAAGLVIRDEMRPYANAAAAFLGEEHPLVHALMRGCAFHHAQLPDEVLRIVEAAALTRLDVLCATSGLQAGVNFPASVAVVVGDPRAEGTKPSPRDFANMAGRAGRPGFETEGLALYLPPSISYGDPLLRARAYLAPEAADLAVTSSLAAQLDLLMQDPEPRTLAELPESIQQLLLGLWAADLREPEALHRFFSRTLAGETNAGPLAEDFAEVLQQAAEGQQGFASYARTALSYSTCLQIAELEESLAAHFADPAWRASPSEQARTVAQLLLRVEYFRNVVGADLTDAVAGDLIAAWVDGHDYPVLSQILDNQTGHRYGLSRTVTVTNRLTGYLAWGAGSLISIVASHRDTDAISPLLAYYIRFGVNSGVAAYLRLIGVSDRRESTALAAEYPADADINLAAVQAWSRTPAVREHLGRHYGDNLISRSVTERDLGIEPDLTIAVPIFFSTSGPHPAWVAKGSIVSLEGDGADWSARDVVSGREWHVGAVPGSGIAAVIGITEERMRGVLFVPTATT